MKLNGFEYYFFSLARANPNLILKFKTCDLLIQISALKRENKTRKNLISFAKR